MTSVKHSQVGSFAIIVVLTAKKAQYNHSYLAAPSHKTAVPHFTAHIPDGNGQHPCSKTETALNVNCIHRLSHLIATLCAILGYYC